VVAHDPGQAERGHHGRERCVRCGDAEAHETSQTCGDEEMSFQIVFSTIYTVLVI
jgi:hypothetical protein